MKSSGGLPDILPPRETADAPVSRGVAPLHSLGEPPSLQIDVRLAGILEQEMGATSPYGEIGGLLLGRIVDSQPPGFVLEDIQSIRTEGENPQWSPSSHWIRSHVERMMAAWRGDPKRTLACIGFYRSMAGRPAAPGKEDLALISRYFPASDAVFMTIQAASRELEASVYIWQAGNACSDSTCFRFPLRRRRQEIDRAPQREAPRLDAPEPVEEAAAPTRSSVNWRRISAMAAVGAAVAFSMYRSTVVLMPSGEAALLQTSLGLSAHRNGPSSVLLTWNRNSEAVRSGMGGRLSIVDGATSHTIELNAKEIREETIEYAAGNENVKFGLEIFDRNGRAMARESIRVVAASEPSGVSDAESVDGWRLPPVLPDSSAAVPASLPGPEDAPVARPLPDPFDASAAAKRSPGSGSPPGKASDRQLANGISLAGEAASSPARKPVQD